MQECSTCTTFVQSEAVTIPYGTALLALIVAYDEDYCTGKTDMNVYSGLSEGVWERQGPLS